MAEVYGKTPVSLLQEYLVLQQKFPYYELTKNGVGTHNPEFTYCVKVDNFIEEGSGRSKQEAKHKAAEKMLKTLKNGDNLMEVDMENTLNVDWKLDFKENYVGLLKELCVAQNYPEPKYTLEEAAGPPHSKIFKIVCSVSQLHESGVCKTKKSAKHKAALKMLERFKLIISENNSNYTNPKNCEKVTEISSNDDEIVKKYYSVKFNGVSVTTQAAPYYKDQQKAYIGLQEASPKLKAFLYSEVSPESHYTLINEIAEELNVTVTSTQIPHLKESDKEYVIVTMNVVPSVSGMGINEECAATNLLDSLRILCSC